MDLDQLLMELLDDAAKRFGPRHKSEWSVEPVRVDGDNFPETIVDDALQTIRVRVTNLVRSSSQEARYELGHESIHCLLATGRRDTIYFEEGLANHYALTLSGIPRSWRRQAKAKLPRLLAGPYEAFRALSPTDKKIRALRVEQPDIDQLEPTLIEKHFHVSRRVAEAVCQRMRFDRPQKM
jgi:hypothetical protein